MYSSPSTSSVSSSHVPPLSTSTTTASPHRSPSDDQWYKPPTTPGTKSRSSLFSSTNNCGSSPHAFNTVSHNTLSLLNANGVSISLTDDVRTVFNIPWHEYPFTLDCRPIQDQYIGTMISALPLPILKPVQPDHLAQRLTDTIQRAISGWLPSDNFLTATLILPLDSAECHELAKTVILPFLQYEYSQSTSVTSAFSHTINNNSNNTNNTLSYKIPQNMSPESLHILTIIQLLVSGKFTPNGQQIFHYRWIPRTTATLFLQQYPFMSLGNNKIITNPGASTSLTSGSVAAVAIARTIPQLPFCILTEEIVQDNSDIEIQESLSNLSISSPSSPSPSSPNQSNSNTHSSRSKSPRKRRIRKRGSLYVGNFEQASNVNVFTRLRIGAVVNVSMDKECPNAFEVSQTKSSPSSPNQSIISTNSSLSSSISKPSTYTRSIDMPRNIHYVRIPLADTTKSEFKNYIPTFVPFIEEHLSKGIPVLIHCHQGLSRSVTITLCYLMIQLGYSLQHAWSLFYGYSQNGRIARPNAGFQRQLIEMDEAIRKAEQEAIDGESN